MAESLETAGQLLERAREICRRTNPRVPEEGEAMRLSRRLFELGYCGYAAAVLEVGRGALEKMSAEWRAMGQRMALYTYKDTSLPVEQRLDSAMEILQGSGLESTTDQETLGLAGAICKRRWQHSGKRTHLEHALAFYLRGYAQGMGADGYLAVNAAFTLHLLARELERGKLPREAAHFRERAGGIYREILAVLGSPKRNGEADWWRVATLIEASIGAGDEAGAKRWLAASQKIGAEAWQRESTLRQLILLTEELGMGQRAIFEGLLREYFPAEVEALAGSPPGPVGLALSGGGFRAALFHLGVLARLAEEDVLRHVEVISCVSGGSIVGACYYLHLRRMLESKADGAIEPGDYVALVQEVIASFLTGVRANVRMRSLAALGANLRVLFGPQYARSDRIAELYDRYFFDPASGSAGGRVLLRQLEIVPKGFPGERFNAERHNWGRLNKVPKLILNSTTLNTGHCWQFTPAGMGEIPSFGESIGGRHLLRRMQFDEAAAGLCDMPLSRAVAASSCVPILFPPIRLSAMYPGMLVALVDGAMFDNQGVAGLLSQDCRSILVSDGSGHIDVVARPNLGHLGVAGRSMGILQTRLRESQHRELSALSKADVIQMTFLHLRQDMHAEMIDWAGCDMRPVGYCPAAPAESGEGSILREMEELLGKMRTDLDTFSDLESHALMFAGYQIAGQKSAWGRKAQAVRGQTKRPAWRFLAVEKAMMGDDPRGAGRLMHHLKAGAARGGKLVRLSRGLRIAGWTVLIAVILMAGLGAWLPPLAVAWKVIAEIGTVWLACYMGLLLVAMIARYGVLRRHGDTRPSFSQLAADVLVLLVGWPVAVFDLAIVRPIYLRLGRLEEAPENPDNPARSEPV